MVAAPATFTSAEIAAYLDRIGYEGSVAPTVETLNGIHRAHLFNVPFENLDIFPLGRPLDLAPAALYDKIVRRHRGGFCYELNGLLAAVLRDLGYPVTIVSVQFVDEDGGFSPPFDHMALVVTAVDAPSPWLVDVAGGRRSTTHPLPLVHGFVESRADGRCSFRLTGVGDRWHLASQHPGESWTPEYTFRLIPRAVDDFLDRCRYQELDPDSHFRRGPLCTLARPSGRVTLSNDQLITTVGDTREERTLSDGEFDEVLRVTFGIELTI